MNFTLKIWRQKDAKAKGGFETYKVENISADTSFLEMLDILNNNLIHEGKEPVAFDHDCREGICGMCSLHIDGHAHGPSQAVTTCQIYMRKFKDGATITINGQNAAATVQNGDAALSKTALGDAAQLRVIANQGGNWRAAAIWYTADQGSEITLSDSDFLYSGSEDGYLEPDDAFLENVALNYYKAFLNAVNDHDLSEMRFSTARNTDEQSSHVFSDLNAGNTYDTSTASCTLDDSSITWGTYSLTVNVSYMCVREDRDTAVREINSNHRTICMVWQDGMWQVDDIAFLSDDDFAAHKYADLNK